MTTRETDIQIHIHTHMYAPKMKMTKAGARGNSLDSILSCILIHILLNFGMCDVNVGIKEMCLVRLSLLLDFE